jgi:hypothetical protein
MQVNECCVEKVLPFLVNLSLPEEREKLDRLGNEIASQEGLHYEGYFASTIEPYDLEHAKAALFFN